MKEFKKTPCPKCGEPPRCIIGAFNVYVDANTGEKVAIGKPFGGKGLHTFECGGGHQWAAEPAEEEKGLRVPEDYVDYSECNCDQALLYLAIIDAMVTFRSESDYPWSADKPLYKMAEKLVEKFKKDYGWDESKLPTRLKRLEEK